jgi:hypothetical protein
MSVFLQVRDCMSDRDYWPALGSMWLKTENLYEDQAEWIGRAHRQPAGSRPMADG